MTTTDELTDRIDRQVDIDAPAERVYALVSRPGWWINEGEVDPEPETRQEDGLTVLVHPTYGEFRLETLLEEPPRHVVFRWIDNVAPDSGTTVEFWIEDRPGGVTLKVSERGFAGLHKDRDAIANQVEENTQGWESELGAAKRYVEGPAA
jgi:uncharacterized protein YndB with AHSA1/START domain